MLIRIRKPSDVRPSQITPESVYLNRRRLLTGVMAGGVVAALGSSNAAMAEEDTALPPVLKYAYNAKYSVPPHSKNPLDKPTSYYDITHYNNYYEFGTGKSDPSAHASTLKTSPWSVTVDGECEKTGTYTLEDILKPHPLEERIYRFRCVEAWAMCIPWVGFPMAALLKRFNPTSRAKYVKFTTLMRPSQMPMERTNLLPWPYVEGLRIDEAMNPLAFMVVGLYGRALPNQDGAPLRIMSPWKYGFKNGKAIVKITFTEKQPLNTWHIAWPQAYGFYANVNPHVPHPNWSQATERVIGGGFFTPRVATPMFNGYSDEVAYLYKGMNLHKYY